MPRVVTFIIIAVVIFLVGGVAFFIVTHNQLGKPCPSGGCVTVLVSGGASLQGKAAGNPTKVIFVTNGQTYTALVTSNGATGSFNYGPINLPNYQSYNVTILSAFGGSCKAGTLALNSKVQGIAWNANCYRVLVLTNLDKVLKMR